MERITVKDLERQITIINRITGECYNLGSAYGGYRLERNGQCVLNCGYIPKRDLYNRIDSFIYGLETRVKIGK